MFSLMLSLKEDIEGAITRDDVRAIVITGLKGKFSAGFDVTVFGGRRDNKEKRELGFMSIQFVTNTLEAARKPVVAAIEGPAFGGGLEIALVCLTELQYGILPGLGGTQRLPRLVGLRRALEMILMSKRVNGEEARNMSLVDAIVPADELPGVARQWALDMLECRRPWMISLYRTDKLEPLEEARTILKSARIEAQNQNPNVVHPFVCIDVIEQGIISGPHNALWKEAEALEVLRQSSTCRSLIHFFFSQREILKIPEMKLLPRKIEKVAVIGGGLNSCEIATMLVLESYRVVLKQKNKNNLLEEIGRVKENLQIHIKNGKSTQEGIEKAFDLLTGVLDYEKFKDVDLVIAAESESLLLKQNIFSDLEKLCPQHCIFATNTSRFSLKFLGEKTNCQNRISGIHFCLSPLMSIVEIVRTESTSPQVITNLIDFARKIRKTPIIVNEKKRFAIDDMFIKYLHAALVVAEHGVDVYRIDQALKDFGMRLGPFRMIDMVGFQTFAVSSKIFAESLVDRSYKPKLIPILQCQGFQVQMTKLSDAEMVEMILFPALNEACRLISEGIVIRSSDLDVASVVGMGFPAYRGGIIYWCNSFEPNYVNSRLEKWSKEYGEFFKPCDYMRELSANTVSLVSRI
ncbi:glyoxysomal fatty acid beta-oxidation multifunctional protein MFP-a [Phtheirospermum japonicum]|uniref:Glyoxysomal fatty acid beta-oxidation multifunctional protein MFP-a n=1 Tax=Phtheirospermum japonicum TaxID=374723 RepID=A0A830B0T0_9LAMI|nr:glyoxysomal fatty acid beta-oxidation multifunctional protein MFP-a [Phtheirospermum japonicum]